MKIKSAVAGLIIATSMIAVVGTSQAGCTSCVNRATCLSCPVQEGFSGVGWHMVPCSSGYFQPARTWDQYVSGGYLAPVGGRGLLFLGQ